MTTTRDTVLAVLHAAMIEDGELTAPTRHTIDEWCDVADDNHISLAEGMDGMREHYTRSRAPITAQGWAEMVRSRRALRRDWRSSLRPERRSAEEVAELAAFDWHAHQAPCPTCHAESGADCINQHTGAPYRHGWHPARGQVAVPA